MASKIKVDQLETADGTGTIALQNQLSGLTSASMPTGSVLQVVSSIMTGTTSTTSRSFVDTGLTVNITPSSSSSKILITTSLYAGHSDYGWTVYTQLVRNSTNICLGTGGSIANQTGNYPQPEVWFGTSQSMTFLDAPARTSAVTDKMQYYSQNGTARINSVGDNDTRVQPSTITVMEIAG